MFFLAPFIRMLITSFKSDQDVFRASPTWLPYDNVRATVDGTPLPLYNIKHADGYGVIRDNYV